ncbi:hypothetical protein ABT352_13515 [Streptosporangium sp. NPDC000563]
MMCIVTHLADLVHVRLDRDPSHDMFPAEVLLLFGVGERNDDLCADL